MPIWRSAPDVPLVDCRTWMVDKLRNPSVTTASKASIAIVTTIANPGAPTHTRVRPSPPSAACSSSISVDLQYTIASLGSLGVFGILGIGDHAGNVLELFTFFE